MELNIKQKIIDLARSSIKFFLDTNKKLVVSSDSIESEFLKKGRGVFVTLTKNNHLRGCIGYIMPVLPLYQAVIENAYNAAFMDTRFSPVIKTEFEDLNIEISVLSIPEKIDSYNNIVLGKHGIILKCGVYEAVFLPQVALENNWNLETTLMHLSFKASGTSDLWQKENTEFFVFEAEIINESEHLI